MSALPLLLPCLALVFPQDARVAAVIDPAHANAGATLTTAAAAVPLPVVPGAVPTIMPGWPRPIVTQSNFHPWRNVTLVDLDGDARMEVVRPSTDGQVYVFRHDGTALPGWPRTLIG